MDAYLNGKLDNEPLTRGNVRRRARGGGEEVPGEELPEHLVQHQLLVLAVHGDEPRQHLLEAEETLLRRRLLLARAEVPLERGEQQLLTLRVSHQLRGHCECYLQPATSVNLI